MNVAVVNPFDPVPGEGLRDTRYGAFCDALVGAGHRVAWISSEWSHTLKQKRDSKLVGSAAAERGFDIQLVPARPYHRNVGLERLVNHAQLGARVPVFLDSVQPHPDVVLVSTPPPRLAAATARWCAKRSTPLLIDVQDLWPETFERLWPRRLKWLNRIVGSSMRRDVRTAYSHSTAGIAVADYYRDHFVQGTAGTKHCFKLALGSDLAQFDANVGSRESLGHLLGDHACKRWILSGGSMGWSLNWEFVVNLAECLRDRKMKEYQVVIAGSGPAENWVCRQAQRRGLDNVTLLGQQPYPVFCSIAAASDYGLNPIRPDSFALFPNRVFDYFAADLLVVNTVPGELADLIGSRGVGCTTASFDVDAAVQFIEAHSSWRPPLEGRKHPKERRGRWVAEFDRPSIAVRLPEILSSVLEHRIAGRKSGGHS